jgi:hypothetical protein
MTPVGEDLRAALAGAVADPAWLADSLATVSASPEAVAGLFPAVSRRCGRGPLPHPGAGVAGWTIDDAARVLLLTSLPLRGEALAAEVTALYRHGDTAEKRGVLRALSHLDIGAAGAELIRDALRTNDTRLVAAALGPCASQLDDAQWRQGVLKCVFMETPLTVVHGLVERADGELARMLAGLADERRAAGRPIPADAASLLTRLTSTEAP